MKIIIIDDEIAALNTFFINLVDKTDYSYQMFNNNPISSLEYVASDKVDAAFLDINMPLINGVDLAEKLIEVDKEIAIVFISGYAHNEDKTRQRIGDNLVGFCYKPYDHNVLVNIFNTIKLRKQNERQITIKSFGDFNIFIDGEPMCFTGKKTKELLALLVDKCGGYVSLETAVTSIWPDSPPGNGKRLYRDSVYKLRRDLSKYSLDIVEFGWGKLRLVNSEKIQCDYWDYLKNYTPFYCGTYMSPSYEWAIETQLLLDNLYNE